MLLSLHSLGRCCSSSPRIQICPSSARLNATGRSHHTQSRLHTAATSLHLGPVVSSLQDQYYSCSVDVITAVPYKQGEIVIETAYPENCLYLSIVKTHKSSFQHLETHNHTSQYSERVELSPWIWRQDICYTEDRKKSFMD